MLDYAHIAMVVSIVSLVIILASCFCPVKIRDDDLADSALSAMVGMLMLSIMATQVLLLFGLHDGGLSSARMIGLYFTAICIFVTGLPLAAEMSREILRVPVAPPIPDRLMNVSLVTFAGCWIVELPLFLTR